MVGALAEQDTVFGPPVPGEVPPGTDVARREVIGEIELTGIGDQRGRGPPGRDLFAPRGELGSQLLLRRVLQQQRPQFFRILHPLVPAAL